ncbi:hypothetical protein ACEU6E_07465 [Halorutilales archaeon Cl-col2-1]
MNRGEDTWVYESIVSEFPGLSLSETGALIVQFAVFEAVIVFLAFVYELPRILVPGTLSVFVAVVGSGFMLYLGESVRSLDSPEEYRALLFDTSIEVVLGLLAFTGFVTYVFVVDPGFLSSVLGEDPPAPLVYVALLIAWDLCYRIGTAWWASLIGLWRSYWYVSGYSFDSPREYAYADTVNIGFAAAQLLLLPIILESRLLVVALVGHVLAVATVSGTSVALLWYSSTYFK